MNTPRPGQRTALRRASALLLAALTVSSISAAPLYWNAASGSAWLTAGNWSTDAAGTTASEAVPTIADDLIFNSTPFNAASNQTLIAGNVAANSLTFVGTSSMRLSQSGTRTLLLGGGGITVNSGATGITLGESTNSLFTETTASQTWANNSASGLSVRRVRASNSATGDVTLTLSANSTGNISFNNSIEDSLDGTKKLAVVIDSAGTGTVTLLASTWTGGTTVKRGILQASAATVGAGNVTLGDTTGNGNATLRVNTTTAVTSDLVVQTGNTGVSTLEFTTSPVGGTYAGNISLSGDLVVGVRNVSGGSFINGVISGSGDLIKGQYQGSNTTGMLTLGGINTHSGDTVVNVGAFTLADNAALTFYIGENGVNNQIRGGGTNTASFAGDFILDLSAAELVQNNSWLIVDIGSLNESFAGTFTVQGFTDNGDDTWTLGDFTFSELTGALTYTGTGLIPEPSTLALLAGLVALGATATLRRRAAA